MWAFIILTGYFERNLATKPESMPTSCRDDIARVPRILRAHPLICQAVREQAESRVIGGTGDDRMADVPEFDLFDEMGACLDELEYEKILKRLSPIVCVRLATLHGQNH